ncbi:MAG: hypothetical protein NVV82_14230 [Sporocytophaga sp.]|nr:hypothetical protein [Sporocytophaga sp.]
MKSHYFIMVLSLLFLNLKWKEPSNPQIVIDRYIEALGGRDRLLKIKTVCVKSEVKSLKYSFSSSSYSQAPNKFKNVISFGTGTAETIINDGKGVEIVNGEKFPLDQDMVDLFHDELYFFPSLYYHTWGYKMHALPDSIIDGIECSMIKVTGFKGIQFVGGFNNENGLLVFCEVLNKKPYVYKIKEYNEIDGIPYPYKTEFIKDGNIDEGTNVEVIFNQKLNKDLFRL